MSIYFAVMAAGLLLGSAALFLGRFRLARGERAVGQVTGFKERLRTQPAAKRQFMPIVRFQPRHGSPVEFQSRFGGAQSAFSIGELVPVRYLADRPEKAEIATAARLWLAPFALLGMALVVTYAAWKASLG